jgi:type II secretory pathway pseudopilin PulG
MGIAFNQQRAPRRSGAFTLLEVITALGVIGLLVSLLLPAVMAALSSARCTQCHDHLKQLALAASSYQSAHGVFPYTTIGNGGPNQPSRSISPQALMLPYVEMEPVYAQINFSEIGDTSGGRPTSSLNGPLLSFSISVYLCPDDKVASGANSYRANMGVNPLPGILVGSSTPGLAKESDTGAFRINRALSPAEFRDGLANTVMFSEKLIGGFDPQRFDPPRDCFYSGYDIETVEDAVLVCQNPPSANPPHDPYTGATWLFGGFDQTWYNHIFQPNSPAPDCAAGMPGGHGAYTARSFHRASVNAALADGAVRSIDERIDLAVWRALGTRAGGEATSTNF